MYDSRPSFLEYTGLVALVFVIAAGAWKSLNHAVSDVAAREAASAVPAPVAPKTTQVIDGARIVGTFVEYHTEDGRLCIVFGSTAGVSMQCDGMVPSIDAEQ